MTKSTNISPDLKRILSMDPSSFNSFVEKWEQEFIKENGDEVVEEVHDAISSAGEPNFETVLFDEMSKEHVRIQFCKKGADYIYHIFFKKDPDAEQVDVMEKIYQAIIIYLPREIEKIVSPPKYVTEFAEPWFIECYTLIIKGIAKRPGSRRIMEDKLIKLLLDKLNEFFEESA